MTTAKPARIWPIMGVLATLVMWGVSALANIWAGAQYGTDDLSKALLGGASLSADIIKAAMIFALTWALASRRWVVAGAASVALLLCATWSVRSAVMFSATQIQETLTKRDHNHKLIQDKRELVRLRSQRAAYLSSQSIKLPGSGKPLREAILAEKKRTSVEFEKQITAAEVALGELSAATPISRGDPIAELLGVDEWIVILPTVALFALMVEFLSATGFWVISQSRVARHGHFDGDPEAQPQGRVSSPSGGGGGSGGSVVPIHKGSASSKRSAKAQNRPQQPKKSADGAVRLLGPQVSRKIKQGYASSPGARVSIAEVYEDILTEIPAAQSVAHGSRAVRRLISEQVGDLLEADKQKIGGQWYFVNVARSKQPGSKTFTHKPQNRLQEAAWA